MHFYLLITPWYTLTLKLSVKLMRHAFHWWFLLIFYDDVYRWQISPPFLIRRQIILNPGTPTAWKRNRDSSPTRHFPDTVFGDSSLTDLKTVPQQDISPKLFLETVPWQIWRQFPDTFWRQLPDTFWRQLPDTFVQSNDLWLIIIIL